MHRAEGPTELEIADVEQNRWLTAPRPKERSRAGHEREECTHKVHFTLMASMPFRVNLITLRSD